MSRSNRPRGRKPVGDDTEDDAFSRMRDGWRRTETRRDGLWNVQPVSATAAVKTYICPGCTLGVPPGQAHIVAWRADGVLGDAADVSNRRHWHSHCWKIK